MWILCLKKYSHNILGEYMRCERKKKSQKSGFNVIYVAYFARGRGVWGSTNNAVLIARWKKAAKSKKKSKIARKKHLQGFKHNECVWIFIIFKLIFTFIYIWILGFSSSVVLPLEEKEFPILEFACCHFKVPTMSSKWR